MALRERHREGFKDRKVEVRVARPEKRVAAQRAERTRRVRRKCGSVKPFLYPGAARASAGQIGIANDIDAIVADSAEGVVETGHDRQGRARLEYQDAVELPASQRVMRGPEFRSRDLVIKRVGESGLAAEIGNAIVAQDAAVRIGAEVAFECGAGGEIEGLLPAETGEECKSAGEALFQAEQESVVIGHAVCGGERE